MAERGSLLKNSCTLEKLTCFSPSWVVPFMSSPGRSNVAPPASCSNVGAIAAGFGVGGWVCGLRKLRPIPRRRRSLSVWAMGKTNALSRRNMWRRPRLGHDGASGIGKAGVEVLVLARGRGVRTLFPLIRILIFPLVYFSSHLFHLTREGFHTIHDLWEVRLQIPERGVMFRHSGFYRRHIKIQGGGYVWGSGWWSRHLLPSLYQRQPLGVVLDLSFQRCTLDVYLVDLPGQRIHDLRLQAFRISFR